MRERERVRERRGWRGEAREEKYGEKRRDEEKRMREDDIRMDVCRVCDIRLYA
jgi:hypothetical protein